MKNSSSTRSQINTELAIRSANKRVKKVIEKHTPDEEKARLDIDFYCECSDADCNKRVKLTLQEYERLHDKHSQFVISKGHSSPTVEKVIKTKAARNLQVVQKYAL